jgi:hypothetical protein
MTDTTSLREGEAHPAALAALQYLNALSFEERQDFLLTFSSLTLERQPPCRSMLRHLAKDDRRGAGF